jgi:hypothetical protein
MAEHVVVRSLQHIVGTPAKPALSIALETRDRPGPAYKAGVFSDDDVWIQVHGGLLVGRARVEIAWRGEFARLDEIKARARELPEAMWSGRPRAGYAVVAKLTQERWIDPVWAGPRTYGYEWIVLENASKRASWLEPKEPSRGGEGLLRDFLTARERSFTG